MSESDAELRAEVRKLREIVYRLEGTSQPGDERRVRLARAAGDSEGTGFFQEIIFLTGNSDDRSATPTVANVLGDGQYLAFEQGGQWFVNKSAKPGGTTPPVSQPCICELLTALDMANGGPIATIDVDPLRVCFGCPTATAGTTDCGGLTFPERITAKFTAFPAEHTTPGILAFPQLWSLGELNNQEVVWNDVRPWQGDALDVAGGCAYTQTSRANFTYKSFEGTDPFDENMLQSERRIVYYPPQAGGFGDYWVINMSFSSETVIPFRDHPYLPVLQLRVDQAGAAVAVPTFLGAHTVTFPTLAAPGATPPGGTITFS